MKFSFLLEKLSNFKVQKMVIRQSQRVAYKPGSEVRWQESSYWCCYCLSGRSDGKAYTEKANKCALCTTYKKIWGHMACYGFTKIFKDEILIEK